MRYLCVLLAVPFEAALADNRIDTIRPDAPELAAYGSYKVGVRPVQVFNPDQVDIVNIDPEADLPDPLPTYDRPLTLEVWYPASLYESGNQTLRAFMRDGRTEIDLHGQAILWATPENRALLTFNNANHNAGAPYPSPVEGYDFDPVLGFAPYEHYADAAWDTARMNNISQHHITAWLGKYLKGESNKDEYLALIPNSNDGVYAVEDGEATADHTYWAGYPNCTAKGLRFEWLRAGDSADLNKASFLVDQ